VPYSGGSVGVEYRAEGTGVYKQAQDLMEVGSGQFSGSILGLQAGTTYDVRFTFGATALIISAQTRPEPRVDPVNKTTVNVSDDAGLTSALNNAQPGEVIILSNGAYSGPIQITASGTEDDPIILRGESAEGVVISSPVRADVSDVCSNSGANLRIRGSYVYVENVTFDGEYWGAIVDSNTSSDLTGVVIRKVKFTNVHCGIQANDNDNTGFYFCNNVLEGAFTNEDTGRKTWDVEGINITGQGHSICHNTFSGFGDTIDIPNSSGNRAIDIYRNDILWGGDDGLELDGGEGNIRAFENRISNSGTGISIQPGGGGPFYMYRNVIYNVGLEYDEGGTLLTVSLPFKFKDGATGMYIFHNTTVRAGTAWNQGESINNSQMFNNLVLGTTNGASFGVSSDSVVDYNGFNRNSPYGANGVQLSLPIFLPPDDILATGSTDWRAYVSPRTFELDPSSGAVNAGVVLPNVNDAFTGTAPDIGAFEQGIAAPRYGAILSDTTTPEAPRNLSAE